MLLRAADFTRRLLKWYDRAGRQLPWRVRGTHTDAYHVLLSEFMLQQTQVNTVIPYFKRFLSSYPTLADLARADDQDVLRLWQGLGYYTRARNLLRCARQVVQHHNGKLPADVATLQTLPGVGRYTAGAIASIGFGLSAPILDGNVTRVLCRLDKIQSDPREKQTQAQLWIRAEQILPERRISDFNSALMELGALVCTPRSPQCLLCPVQKHCRAYADGVVEKIPLVRKRPPTPIVRRTTYCIASGNRWLIEQRAANGRWAGLWQFITRPTGSDEALPVQIGELRRLGTVSHALTHRRYIFEVFATETQKSFKAPPDQSMRWVKLAELDRYPLSKPQLRIADWLKQPDSPVANGCSSGNGSRVFRSSETTIS